MLKRLYIKNFALIDEIDVSFNDGFTSITGETGAGKSIILGALSLVLGDRAELSSIREGQQKCIIEAEFMLPDSFDKSFFTKNELDFEKVSFLRREILSSGKSRAFINDTPVNLKQMRDLASSLIDIHSQNENISLNSPEYQLYFLDDYAGITDLRTKHSESFAKIKELQVELEQLKAKQLESIQNRDFWQFQFDEISEVAPVSGEEQELEERLRVMSSAEDFKSSLHQINAELGEHDNNLLSSLRGIEGKLSGFKGLTDKTDSIIQRFSSARIELEDIHGELESLSSEVEYNEEDLRKTEDRLNVLNHLFQKHRVQHSDQLLELVDDFSMKLDSLSNSDEQIAQLELKIAEIEKTRAELSSQLSEKRIKSKKSLEQKLTDSLTRMQIPDAQIQILVEESTATYSGNDKVQYLFTANIGQKPQPIQKVASGGERSRLMLALRYVLSEKSQLPAIILDEIDSGISGEVAKRVGDILLEMANRMQVVSITHLPQIAAKGQDHKLVYKTEGRTFMKSLNKDERIVEIAQMLSGANPGEEARLNAKELLN